MNEPDHALSVRTTPTWEVELLISGVAVFAMLQLPGWLDDRVFALSPRMGEDWQMILRMLYLYAKSAAVVLAITFALHLLMRAHWIALVGMHSVFPMGVRLDKLRMGPIQRAVEEARPDSAIDAIERADNRASVVFAIGVSIASMIATICVFIAVAILPVLLLSRAFGLGMNPMNLIVGVFAVSILPYAIASMLDYGLAGRLRPGGLPYRAIGAILGFYSRSGMGRRNNQILAILTSNGGERRMMALVFGIMIAAIVGVAAAYAVMRKQVDIGTYALFPGAGASRIDPAHYDDQRDPSRDDPLPYVQAMTIAGPYLKLVVPYDPRRDEGAMRDCRVPGNAKAAQRTNILLACLSALHPVSLDGKPLPGLRYETASDPRADRPALLAMIDVRALAPGRHELQVSRPPRSGKEEEDGLSFDRIPFWH